MTRLELLTILVGQARTNGFEFRRWYSSRLLLPWHGSDKALQILDDHRHYYALLFSHEFAQAFWKPGQPITFQVPAQSFERLMADGSVATVQRKPFMRRSVRPEAWRYHLREMAASEEPLRYMRRYLHIAEEADEAGSPAANHESEKKKEVAPTLALARKAHERKQLVLSTKPIPEKKKRGARVPGTRKKAT